MTFLKRNPTVHRFGLAIAAGLLLAMAFPNWGLAGAAWVAPGLLLLAGAGAAPGTAFRIGFAAGVAFYLTALYWLLLIPVKFVPIIGWIALALYLSLYPATWLWLSWRMYPGRMPIRASAFDPEVAEAFRSSGWLARTIWLIQVAALWVGLEMILGRFLTGFPWLFLGSSQYKVLPVIQISSITGVYGVSFLAVWFGVALFAAGVVIARHPPVRGGWFREIVLPTLALLAVILFGWSKIRDHRSPATTVTAALIQPSIPQTLIWDPDENETRFQQLMELTARALETNPDLVIWPEAAVPNMLRYHEETAQAVQEMAVAHNVWAIVGSDDAIMRPGSSTLDDVSFFNSAFAISPEGKITGVYKKRQLVIFGEYVPLAEYLPFLRMLSPAGEGSGFTPGSGVVPFPLKSLDAIVSVLICFEDVFPHLAREYVQRDTDFLVNLTNNGWFGESAAQWQHAASAAFRAVENRIPLVRCANNGLTCWVDPIGRMHEVFFPGSDDVYRAGFKTAEVPVLAPGEERALTFYTRHGDIFGWACLLLAGLRVILIGIGSRATPQP